MTQINDDALDVLFRDARTYNNWQDKDIPDSLLHELHELVKFGPTSANCSPMRVVFVKSEDAKARLKPHLAEGNVDKTMGAPVTAREERRTCVYEWKKKNVKNVLRRGKGNNSFVGVVNLRFQVKKEKDLKKQEKNEKPKQKKLY